MEIVFGLIVVVAVGSLIYFNRTSRSLDINNDGKVDLQDAQKAVDNAVDGVKATVKAAAKKPAAKKPAAKKPAAKKRK